MPPQDPACYHIRDASLRELDIACLCSSFLTRRSTPSWCTSARSLSAGTHSPTSSAFCSAGWYARILIRSGKLWGGKAPLTVTDFDDFVLWVTLGIILGGRIGYVLFYNLPHFATHPLEIFQLWNGGMSFHGGFTGCVVAVLAFGYMRGIPVLSLGDITCAVGPIGLFLGRIANFINGELWGRPTDAPWAMVFPSGGPVPRHQASSTRQHLKVLSCLPCWPY